MDYREAVSYLNALIDYEKSPNFSYGTAFKLDRVIALMDELGAPQRAFSTLHVAGTKGKGSVAAYLDALLRLHGCRTGLYTSPHLVDFRERIRVDGEKIGEATFAEIMTRLHPWIERWQTDHPTDDRLSFFDALTAVGFETFRRERAEWGVVEVGMGGRLDATNVVTPRVAIITPIALEHTRYLGPTITHVAREKAGIIKSGAQVVIGKQCDEAAVVLADRCAQCGIRPIWLGRDVAIDESNDHWSLQVDDIRFDDIEIGMFGAHQRWNFAAAVAALRRAGIALDVVKVRRAAKETVVPGRLQVIDGTAPTILDVSHTPDSARRLRELVETRFPRMRHVLVFGCAEDKRIAEIAEILAPTFYAVYLTSIGGPRGMSAHLMRPYWEAVHRRVYDCFDVEEAFARACWASGKTKSRSGLVAVAGSFILVGTVMDIISYYPP